MSVRRVVNDPRAPYVGDAVNTQANDAGSKVANRWLDQLGRVAQLGRGESDPNVTYLMLFNTNSTECYLYPNADGDALTVSTVKP